MPAFEFIPQAGIFYRNFNEKILTIPPPNFRLQFKYIAEPTHEQKASESIPVG